MTGFNFLSTTDLDDCAVLECNTNAQCVSLEDGAMCQCLEGFTWEGKSCLGKNKNEIQFSGKL